MLLVFCLLNRERRVEIFNHDGAFVNFSLYFSQFYFKCVKAMLLGAYTFREPSRRVELSLCYQIVPLSVVNSVAFWSDINVPTSALF